MAEIKCEIHSILAELSDIDVRNERKVVAIASWNDLPETVNIRKYNVKAGKLYSGSSLSFKETEEMLYALLASPEIEYDVEKVTEIIRKRENRKVDIEGLMQGLDDDEEITDGPYVRNQNGCIKIERK